METMNETRRALAASQDALKNAEAKVKTARAAVVKAGLFVAKAEGELKKHADLAKDATSARAKEMAALIKGGFVPIAEDDISALAEQSLAQAEAEARLKIAAEAHAALVAEERGAEAALAEAKQAVAGTVKAVQLDEALRIAARIEELDRQAMALRVQLGLTHGFVGSRLGTLPPMLAKILQGTDASEAGTTNTAENFAAKASTTTWSMFETDLHRDPQASLHFHN
jgi:hypothetical protein